MGHPYHAFHTDASGALQLSADGDEHHERDGMLIVQQKSRREFMRLSANSFLSAAALATLPALAAGATESRDGRMQTHRGERRRFKSIDEALAQGVSNGAVAGVVALAADSRGVVYEAAYGKRDLAGAAGITQDTVFWLLSMTKAITAP